MEAEQAQVHYIAAIGLAAGVGFVILLAPVWGLVSMAFAVAPAVWLVRPLPWPARAATLAVGGLVLVTAIGKANGLLDHGQPDMWGGIGLFVTLALGALWPLFGLAFLWLDGRKARRAVVQHD